VEIKKINHSVVKR